MKRASLELNFNILNSDKREPIFKCQCKTLRYSKFYPLHIKEKRNKLTIRIIIKIIFCIVTPNEVDMFEPCGLDLLKSEYYNIGALIVVNFATMRSTFA